MTAVLGPIADPHCQRDSRSQLEFKVGAEKWCIDWGRFDAFGSAAYWIDQTVRGSYVSRVSAAAERRSLAEETVFCLLGGYGVSAETALTAHVVVMEYLDAHPSPTADELEAVLRRPLPDTGRRYRFPSQRGRRIASALEQLRTREFPSEPVALRDTLLSMDGIGPKTASWIVRNVTGSSRVAIIDIWLVRALTATGVFQPSWRANREYASYETAFLQYAAHGRVHAGALDLCIWDQARVVGADAFEVRTA